MRNVPAGTIQQAIQRVYDAVGGGIEGIARKLGTVNSTVSYGTEISEHRPGGLGANYLDRLCQDNAEAALVVAQHFAGYAGAAVQPVHRGDNVSCLYLLSGEVAKECGDALPAIIRASQNATAGNCDEAVREIDEAVARLMDARAEILAKRGAA